MLSLSCSMWDLVPWLGIEPRPPTLDAQSFSHWTTREVPLWFFWVPTVTQRRNKPCMLSRSGVPDSLRPHGLQPARLLCLWDFSGKNTGVGCHFLLQKRILCSTHTELLESCSSFCPYHPSRFLLRKAPTHPSKLSWRRPFWTPASPQGYSVRGL